MQRWCCEAEEMRVGMGYDAHALVPGRKLVLGGVDIPAERGLEGHSDADVLAHAIMDALLGAGALGDKGEHFPSQDASFAGASSLRLLGKARDLVTAGGWQVKNVDATLVAQAPRLAPHLAAMRRNIAEALELDLAQVSVKVTSTDGLGFVGEGKGMAAHAVALLVARE